MPLVKQRTQLRFQVLATTAKELKKLLVSAEKNNISVDKIDVVVNGANGKQGYLVSLLKATVTGDGDVDTFVAAAESEPEEVLNP